MSIVLLSGCVSGEGNDRVPAVDTVQVIGRDVEAPEVFSVQDSALWDGRPSLGGIWVAAPDVGAPERVIIRNRETGASVIGALFKRERDNPGPALQLSSEAASALGILAGSPTDVEVVALRREDAAVPAPRESVEPEPEVSGAVPESDPTPAPRVTAVTTLSGRPPDGSRSGAGRGGFVTRLLGWGDDRLAVEPGVPPFAAPTPRISGDPVSGRTSIRIGPFDLEPDTSETRGSASADRQAFATRD